MKKWTLLIILALLIAAVTAYLFGQVGNPPDPLPTLAIVPSNTVTHIPTSTSMPTHTTTNTPSQTATSTVTPTTTSTATLSTLVLYITVVNPGVTLYAPPTATPNYSPTPLPTVDVPLPPGIVPLVNAGSTTPQPGWTRYETADPAFNYVTGRWFTYRANRATERGYSYSADVDARVVLPFEGAGLRVRYVAYSLYGIFEIRIDGRVAATVDSYSPRAAFQSTDIFGLTQGKHTVEIVNTGRKNPASTGYMVALDSIEVYRGVPPTFAPSGTALPTVTWTPSPVPAQSIKLVSGPPTVRPTNSPPAPVLAAASLIIAYDENGNRSVDPAEGVRGISVRLVRVGSNEVVASGFTNSEGYVRLETMTDTPVRMVVPYFGKFWDVPIGRGTEPRFTLVLPPGNQPGLIP